jgi:hypothetical protein
MSREEKYTIKCDRCGKIVSFENAKAPPEDLNGWYFLEVHRFMADAEETSSLIAFLTRGKYFDLCGVCFTVLEDTIHNFLPPGVLKAFEETKEKPVEKPKDGGDSEQKEKGAPGTDP